MNNRLKTNGNANEHTVSEVEIPQNRMSRRAPMIAVVVLGTVLSVGLLMHKKKPEIQTEVQWTLLPLNSAMTIERTEYGLAISYQGMSQELSSLNPRLTFSIGGHEIEAKVVGDEIYYRPLP